MDVIKLADKTLKFLLRSQIESSMFDISKYLTDRCPTMDICNVTKKYLYISNAHEFNLRGILTDYLNDQLEQIKVDDLDILTDDDIDIYFDITEKDDTIIILEQSK